MRVRALRKHRRVPSGWLAGPLSGQGHPPDRTNALHRPRRSKLMGPVAPTDGVADRPVDLQAQPSSDVEHSVCAPDTSRPRPRPRRHRRWAVAVASTVAVSLGVLVFTSDVALTNRQLLLDSEAGTGAFASDGNSPDFVLDPADGSVRMQGRSASDLPAFSAAPFARATKAVDVSAGVASVSGPASFGVVCWHTNGREGYALVASTNAGVSVRRLDTTNIQHGGTVLAVNPRATSPRRDASLRISCDGLAGAHVLITGYVNGRRVVSALDTRGFEGFRAAGLLFHGATAGSEVRFDCARAAVTGSAALGGDAFKGC